MDSKQLEEVVNKLSLTDEVNFIGAISNTIDNITISARDASVIVEIKDALKKVQGSISAKNDSIGELIKTTLKATATE